MVQFKDYSLRVKEVKDKIKPLVNDCGLEVKKSSIHVPGYRCDKNLHENVTSVLKHVISYIATYKHTMNSLCLEQKPVRPLSVVMFGPPGTGKSQFAKTIETCVKKILVSEDKSHPMTLREANFAEYERVELLGQQLVRLRNEKIDADYPPMLFVDEADSKPDAFVRLLTMLWDGKFFWDVQERILGSMIIFLAASTIRCKKQFEKMVRKVPGRLSGYCGKFLPPKNKKPNQWSWECPIHPLACPVMNLREPLDNAYDALDPWQAKGSDFVSRINGPIVFLQDLTQKEYSMTVPQDNNNSRKMREWLFADIVKRLLKSVNLSCKIDEEVLCWVKENKPRYGTRSLTLLAESIDLSKVKKHRGNPTVKKNAFHLLSEDDVTLGPVRDMHFPKTDEVNEAIRQAQAVENRLIMEWTGRFYGQQPLMIC